MRFLQKLKRWPSRTTELPEDEEEQDILSVQAGDAPLPFFTEYPHFLWGEVNYDSMGDCRRPTDRAWTMLDLKNRETQRRVSVLGEDDTRLFTVTGDTTEDITAAAYLTALRSGGSIVGEDGVALALSEVAGRLPGLDRRLAEADEMAAMFLDPALAVFDTQGWWGGWKWRGTFASDMTLGERLTMRAAQGLGAGPDLVEWLKDYWRQPPPEWHREGVRHALTVITGRDPDET